MTNTVGTVRVVSKRAGGVPAMPKEKIYDVDRTDPILGNKHHLKNINDSCERKMVIEAHLLDVMKDLSENGPISKRLDLIAEEVSKGENIALRCWCAPKPCHADTYKRLIYDKVRKITKEEDFLF